MGKLYFYSLQRNKSDTHERTSCVSDFTCEGSNTKKYSITSKCPEFETKVEAQKCFQLNVRQQKI